MNAQEWLQSLGKWPEGGPTTERAGVSERRFERVAAPPGSGAMESVIAAAAAKICRAGAAEEPGACPQWDRVLDMCNALDAAQIGCCPAAAYRSVKEKGLCPRQRFTAESLRAPLELKA